MSRIVWKSRKLSAFSRLARLLAPHVRSTERMLRRPQS